MILRLPQRKAFSLIECLVVMAIIAVLASLLLPAVQMAREAARRTQCANNLMQLGVAIQNYESVHEVLPPGVVNESGPISNIPVGYHFGWLAQILPFIEQKNTYRHLDHRTSIYSPNNSTVRALPIRALLCPSDPGASSTVVAPSSYAGCYDDDEVPISADNTGVFFLNSAIRFEDIPDGRPHTIFLGEKRIEPNDLGWASGTRATLRNAATRPGRVPSLGPSAGSGSTSESASTVTNLVGGFGSLHPGGANIAFGDGSVRFIKKEIDARIFRLLANRADGEMIGGNEY